MLSGNVCLHLAVTLDLPGDTTVMSAPVVIPEAAAIPAQSLDYGHVIIVQVEVNKQITTETGVQYL